ncbi:MAG: hypothetical protein KTR31_41390 [Myxococcales bacterium]|nr:hypothetical protein [Myxococcales bacterium]
MTRLAPIAAWIVLSGCTDPPSSTVPSAPVDTAEPLTESGPVEIRVRGVFAGDDSVAYAHDVDGTYLDQVPVDLAGYALLPDVPAGGMITVAVRTGGSSALATVRDVQPGEVLTIGSDLHLDGHTSVEVTYDASAIPNAARVDVFAGCDQSSGTVADTVRLDVWQRCLDDGGTVAAIVRDEQDRPIAYASRAGLPDAEPFRVDLSPAEWQTELGTVQLHAHNAPGAGHLVLSVFAMGGSSILQTEGGAHPISPTGSVLARHDLVSPIADQVLGVLELYGGDIGATSTFPLDLPTAGAQIDIELDLSELVLPTAGAVALSDDGRTATSHLDRPARCAQAGEADVAVWSFQAEGADGLWRLWSMTGRAGQTLEITRPDLGPDTDLWWPEPVSQHAHAWLAAHEELDYLDLRGPLLDPMSGYLLLRTPFGPGVCISYSEV